MKKMLTTAILAVAVLVVGGCASTGGTGAAIKDDGLSGTVAFVRVPTKGIPGVRDSNERNFFLTLDYQQALFVDKECQTGLAAVLPTTKQEAAKEIAWASGTTAIAQGAFASAFPGVSVGNFMLGGAALGAVFGANNERGRDKAARIAAQADCVERVVGRLQQKHKEFLPNAVVIPWRGIETPVKFPPLQ